MTEQIIKTILVLSAAGGCLALLFLVLKPVFSRLFGNAFRFYMWLLVFVLLLAPARIDFKSIPPKQPMDGGVEITANIDGEKNAPAQENAVTARENKPETAEKAAAPPARLWKWGKTIFISTLQKTAACGITAR